MTPSYAPTVLLTGFDPFGGETVNPSWEAVARLHGETIARHRIECAQLPTSFVRGANALIDALDRHRPSLVICVGQAGGRMGFSVERVAINLIDARISDNDGARPIDLPCVSGAPAAYFSTLPIKAMRAAMNAAEIPAHISHTAGTFVCNHVFYVLMHALASEGGRVRGGFVHVPYLPEQARRNGDAPCMSIEQIVAGLKIGVDAAVRNQRDLRIAAGETH
jgi:pyroglutamyl-peptidase